MIIRIEFWATLYYNYRKDPPPKKKKKVLVILSPPMSTLTRTAIREALSWNRAVSGGRRVQALCEAATRMLAYGFRACKGVHGLGCCGAFLVGFRGFLSGLYRLSGVEMLGFFIVLSGFYKHGVSIRVLWAGFRILSISECLCRLYIGPRKRRPCTSSACYALNPKP